jgi:hypothetical protein
MFRNVIGVQEAVVHRQSNDSLLHENKQIKDIQSDDIVQTYSTLKTKWFYQREHLIEYLKTLQKHQTYSSEIQHVQSLIECLNELIENGEITKNCQTLIHDNIHFFPQTYILTRKPLGNKLIRLPRHVSKPIIHLSNSLEKISSEIIHLQRSNEKLKHQVIITQKSVILSLFHRLIII